MIITSGIYRGIPLSAPKSMETRPTLAKTRQAIFNMIRPYIDGADTVDVFAGTGALGFESLSNGAKKAVFIDTSTAGIIKKNAEKLKVPASNYEIMPHDFKKSIDVLAKKGFKASLLFADPPYNKGFIKMLLQMTRINDILNDGAIVVLEIHSQERTSINEALAGWEVLKDKQYGDTHVLCLQKGGGSNG